MGRAFATPLLVIALVVLVGCGGSKQPNPASGGAAGGGGTHNAAGGAAHGGAGHGGTGGSSGTAGDAGEAGSGLGGEENAGSGQGAAAGTGGTHGGTGGTHGGGTGGDMGTAGEGAGAGGEGPAAGGTTSTGGSGGHGGSSGNAGHGGTAGVAGSGAGLGGSAGAGAGTGGGAGIGGSGGAGGTPGEVTLSVVANPDPAVSNGPITYEFKLTNSGGSTLTNVVLTDVTQNVATAYVSQITGGGGCNGGSYCSPGTIVTWPAFTLAPGQTQTVWLTSTVANATANGTVIHNTATVSYSNKTVMQPTDVVVDASVALHVGITEDHNPVRPGDQLTYTVTVGNTGTQSLPTSTAGVITASVPDHTTFVAASGGGVNSGGTIEWNVGSVDPGRTQHYTYTVTVNGTSDGTVLKPGVTFWDGTTNVARAGSLTEVRASFPLALSMTANPDPGSSNNIVFYEYKVSNLGDSTLTNVVLSEVTQNVATAYVSQITGGGGCNGGSYCSAGTIVTWPAFTLAPGQTQTVWLTNTLANATPNGTIMRNSARVAYAGGMVFAKRDLAVDNAPALHVSVTEDRNPVRAGDQLTYTVTVGNTGTQSLPLSAAGVLTAAVPAGTSFVSASGGGASSGGNVQWNVGSINPGGTLHYTFTVAVGGGLVDGAVLEPLVQLWDGGLSVARAGSLTEVRASVPLRLSMVANPDPGSSNSLVSYEFKVSNVGTSTLTNVLLTDVTQQATTAYVSQMTGGGGCNGGSYCTAGTLVSWPAFTLAPGQTQTVWLTNTLANGTPNGTIVHNEARLAYAGGLVLAANDLSVDNAPKLHLAMNEDHNPVHPGDQVTYALSLSNSGTQAFPLSTAGVLTASAPPGTTFVSASGGGTNSNGVVTWNVGWVDPGVTQKYTFTVSVGSSVADGTLLPALAQLWDSGTSVVRSTTSTEARTTTPLTLDVSVSPDPVAPNALTTYTFVVTNTGASALTNVVLTDVTFDAATAYVSQMTGGGGCNGGSYCTQGTIVSWPALTLASGQSATVTRTDTISNGTPNGTLSHNQARVSYAGGTIVKSKDISVHN